MECIKRREIIAEGFEELSKTLAALGDSSRQIIFTVLLEHIEPMRVGDIAELSHFTRPSVSHHLKVLREAGLVDMFEDGTKNYYFIKADKEKWAKIKAVVDFTYESVTDGETHKNEVRK